MAKTMALHETKLQAYQGAADVHAASQCILPFPGTDIHGQQDIGDINESTFLLRLSSRLLLTAELV